ncbi:MAG: HAMP domain-containing sensor histidine kinase [Pseudomonadota bacterium]
MKLAGLGLPSLDMPRLGWASFRRRLLFRGVFLLLALATLALAVVLLQDEKERSYRAYQQNFRRAQADWMARLRQPAALLVLLNPQRVAGAPEPTPVRPLVLPYPALDFDDPNKVQQAVEQSGCALHYPDGSTLCAGVGTQAATGGFLYLAGSFRAGDLAVRDGGELDIEAVHRAAIRLELRGELLSWVAPFERVSLRGEPLLRARLLGFETTGDPTLAGARPVPDLRGWLWQSAGCAEGAVAPDCARRVFYAIRLPVRAFREGVAAGAQPAWPPADLDRMRLRLQVLAPGSGGAPLFDSNAAGARPGTSPQELAQPLAPGEMLSVTRLDGTQPPLVLKGDAPAGARTSPLVLRLIDRLPVAQAPAPVEVRDTMATPVGTYEVLFAGDARGIDRGLGVIATRMAWYVGAMLAAIVLAWLVIEIGLIRRIAVLTRRAAAVSHNMQRDAQGGGSIGRLDVSDLRGSDELGILAGGLADLLQRVKDDVGREQLRAQQERDMLQAVGHEILSPLQSLMVLHPDPDDPARRYVQRMQQAVRVLYGQASPGEALQAAELALAPLDLDAFLREVAANAHHAGIAQVGYAPHGAPVTVRADPFSLEDVVTHILCNADRHRAPGTEIRLGLRLDDGQAVVRIHNEGEPIAAPLLERVFEYGVRDGDAADNSGRRGQGLFVARTYMAKMGGTVSARNEDGGVSFLLGFPRAG